MAVFSMSDNARILNGMTSYAAEKVIATRYSDLFSRVPLLTYLAGKNKSENPLGRPGTLGLVGGSGNFDQIDVERESAYSVNVRLHAKATKAFKWMGERDTTPSTGNTSQDQENVSATFRYADVRQRVKVWNNTLRYAKGPEQIANATKEATESAMAVISDELMAQLWYGSPTSQSANIWSKPLGVVHAMNTNNTYGNIDRTNSDYAFWKGKRVTSSKVASLSLIDDANLTQGCSNTGGGVDFVIVGAANFLALKNEANSRGQIITGSDMPAYQAVSSKFECIKYGKTTIVHDPFLTGDWTDYDSGISDASKVVAMFTTEDWVFSTAPDGNWNLSPFKDQSDVDGGDDAVTATITVRPRLRCNKPGRSILYTNVSAAA